MLRNELLTELQRLEKGFKRDQKVTPERMDAFFARFSHISASALRDAVTTLLLDPSYPSSNRFGAAIEAASERERSRRVAQNRRDESTGRFFPERSGSLAEVGMAVWNFVMSRPSVPTAKEVAVVMAELRGDHQHPELETWISRLEAWPENTKFPLIPDDAELEKVLGGSGDPRWWEPGVEPGGVAMVIASRSGRALASTEMDPEAQP